MYLHQPLARLRMADYVSYGRFGIRSVRNGRSWAFLPLDVITTTFVVRRLRECGEEL